MARQLRPQRPPRYAPSWFDRHVDGRGDVCLSLQEIEKMKAPKSIQDPIRIEKEVIDDVFAKKQGDGHHRTPNEREGRKRDLGQASRVLFLH